MSLQSTDYALLAQDSYQKPDLSQTVTLGGITYQPIDYADNPRTGFQATAYQRVDTHEVVIAYRGTEFGREPVHDGAVDAGMAMVGVNAQTPNATAFTQRVMDEVKRDAEKHSYPVNISVTGHSLGGTLAEIEAHKFGLHGETFNAYGAAGLMQDVPRGGNQVIDHVRATDVVSAASAHFGEVRVYATQQDIAAIRGAGYTNTPLLNELPAHTPVLGKIQGDAHAIANFAPSPAHPSIIGPEDSQRYQANKVAVDAYRSDIHHAATLASLPGKAVTGVAETTIAAQEKITQAELYAGHKAVQGAEYVGHKTAQGAEYVEHKTVQGAQYVEGKAAQGAHYVEEKTVQGAHYVEDKTVQGAHYVENKAVQGAHYVSEKATQGAHAVSQGVQQVEQSAAKGYDNLTHPGTWLESKPAAPAAAAPSRPNDPRNPEHPGHAQYQKLSGQVADAYAKHGITLSGDQLERTTARVMLDAQANHLDVKEIHLNRDLRTREVGPQSFLIAFSGGSQEVTSRRSFTDAPQAQQTAPEQTFQQLGQLQQHQTQAAMQQAQAPQINGPGMGGPGMGGPGGR